MDLDPLLRRHVQNQKPVLGLLAHISAKIDWLKHFRETIGDQFIDLDETNFTFAGILGKIMNGNNAWVCFQVLRGIPLGQFVSLKFYDIPNITLQY